MCTCSFCYDSTLKHNSKARVMLRIYSWMKVASFHRDYICLVTVHSWNFTVWWCKWIPCGSRKGVEKLSMGKVSGGESHPGLRLPIRGFSNCLLQFFKNFEENSLHNYGSLTPPSTVTSTEFTSWKKVVMLKSVTPLWLHRNKCIWESKGYILATVSWPSRFTIRNGYE